MKAILKIFIFTSILCVVSVNGNPFDGKNLSNETNALISKLASSKIKNYEKYLVALQDKQQKEEMKLELSLQKESYARCQRDMGSYGKAVINSCAKEEYKSINRLLQYRHTHKHAEIVAFCFSSMRGYGYTVIETCVNEEKKSFSYVSSFLNNAKTNRILGLCLKQMRSYGYTIVETCLKENLIK